MPEQLVNPRVDATETVTWARVKDPDQVTATDHVIMHNLAAIMKTIQLLTERVEKLSITVEKLANSQKLNKNRRSSLQSVATSVTENIGEEEEDDAALSASVPAKALQQLEGYAVQLSILYADFITATKKKVYQIRLSVAAPHALEFVADTITKLNARRQNEQIEENTADIDEDTAKEMSDLLEQLNEDASLDLYVKLGKAHMKKGTKAKKGKGKSKDLSGDDVIDVDEQATSKSYRPRKKGAHRPNLDAVRIEDEEEEEEDAIAPGPSQKRRRTQSIQSKKADDAAFLDDEDAEDVEDDEEEEAQ